MASVTMESQSPSFLDGGGEMGARIRAFDWANSPAGHPHGWPASLRTTLRMMLTTNHPVFVFWGAELTCLYNDAYAASLGPEMHPQILGMPGRIVWDEIWSLIGPQIELVCAGRGSTWHEDHLIPITRFGKVEDVYWTYGYGPIHDDDAPNCVGGVLVLCRETTERVEETVRVRADLERYRQLFEQSPGFICVLRGPEHRFEYCNPALLEIIGRVTAPIGSTVADALPEVVSQGYTQLLDQVYLSGATHSALSARLVLNDAERLVDFAFQPLRDAGETVTGILVQGIDVTQRERAQADLARSEARLRIATDAAYLGIYEYDIRRKRIQWDSTVRELWGVSDGAEITYDAFLAGIVAEDRVMPQRAMERALDPVFGGSFCVEYRVCGATAVARWVRATGRAEFQGGLAVRLVGTVQDVSDEKRHAAELIAADRRKDIFLATLAHELRNPLAPIRNAAHILAMPDISREQIAWAQKVIARQSAHMASLLDDLLDVARLTQGRLSLKRETIDIRSVLESAIETVRPQLDAKRHTLHIDGPVHSAMVFVDPVRLCQVFSNLLGNAIKYMEPEGTIEVTARIHNASVAVHIRDTGIGLSAAALPRVFGMFQQSAAGLEHAEGGLGIGLAIVRAIVELHGGTVDASSDGPGRGSDFSVELPLASMPPDVRGSTMDTTSGVRPMYKRILVADDNRDAAESLAILLGLQGHNVQVAADGIEALEMVASFGPDVVLLDIGMPRMNGYDVARTLRDRGSAHHLRLIALTGWGQADDRQRAIDAGFDEHLTKPPDIDELLNAISR